MLELAREQDWEAVQRLSVQIHDMHASWRPDIYCRSEEPFPRENFLQGIRDRLVYVAKLDRSVVGYVTLSVQERSGPGMVPVKVMRIDSICVDEPLRGHGIGRTMVGEVRLLAKAFGCGQLLLGVHAENDVAVGFYQKCGFRIRTINMDMNL